jgi:hypothetical protein
MEETGTYLKKLVDIVTPETQVDEMYQRIHEVVGLLDKVVQRSWSFYAERSPSLSDYWEKNTWEEGLLEESLIDSEELNDHRMK